MLTEDEIYEVLRECYDPEIPVNIVDLGLIYGVTIADGVVNILLTLTAPGCSMSAMIAAEIEDNNFRAQRQAFADVFDEPDGFLLPALFGRRPDFRSDDDAHRLAQVAHLKNAGVVDR